jgi:cell fate regulator YaaT (PSP1 superfamily)
MCCLGYEYAHYRESKRCLPKVGSITQTEKGPGKIIEISVLKDRANVLLEEGGRLQVPLSSIAIHKPGCPHQGCCGGAGAEEGE